jgi:hypothetical protein
VNPFSLWRRAAGPFVAGLAGIVALAPVASAALRGQLARASQPVPAALPLLVAAQPLVLLAIASVTGAALTPKLGLHSRLSESPLRGCAAWKGMRGDLLPATIGGVLAASAISAADALLRMRFADLETLPPLLAPRDWRTLTVGVLYGGVTEEVLMRWGVMSIVAWLISRARRPRMSPPDPAVMWTAIIIAALLFGAGHLPAIAVSGARLTATIVVRTILLNALGGIVFGWLFWRRNLEAAMVSHASTHVTWAVAAALFRV